LVGLETKTAHPINRVGFGLAAVVSATRTRSSPLK